MIDLFESDLSDKEIIQILVQNGTPEHYAIFTLAMYRGEIKGDLVEEPNDSNNPQP